MCVGEACVKGANQCCYWYLHVCVRVTGLGGSCPKIAASDTQESSRTTGVPSSETRWRRSLPWRRRKIMNWGQTTPSTPRSPRPTKPGQSLYSSHYPFPTIPDTLYTPHLSISHNTRSVTIHTTLSISHNTRSVTITHHTIHFPQYKIHYPFLTIPDTLYSPHYPFPTVQDTLLHTTLSISHNTRSVTICTTLSISHYTWSVSAHIYHNLHAQLYEVSHYTQHTIHFSQYKVSHYTRSPHSPRPVKQGQTFHTLRYPFLTIKGHFL